MPIALYVQRPFANRHENRQLEELLSMLDSAFGTSTAENLSLLVNFRLAKGRVGGQFDVVAIRDHMIMILELKDMVATVIGNDSDESWTLTFGNGSSQRRQLFDQMLRQHNAFLAYLMQDFRRARAGHEEDHFYVDARLVFREGSEFKVSLSSPQVQRWFRVITFGEVLHEVATGGKEEFTISPADVQWIAHDLDLSRVEPHTYFMPLQSVEEVVSHTLAVMFKRSPLPQTLNLLSQRLSAIVGSETLDELLDLTQAFRKLHTEPDMRDLKATVQYFKQLSEEMDQRRAGTYQAGVEEVRWRQLQAGLYREKGEEFLDTLDTDVERLLIDGVGALSYAYSLVCYSRMLKLREAEASGNTLMMEPLDDEVRGIQFEMDRALNRYRSYLADRRAEKDTGTRSLVKRTKLITYLSAILDARPLADSIPSVNDLAGDP